MTMKSELAALRARVAELEASQPARRKPYAKTATQELPIDSSAASRASGAYAEFSPEAQRAKAEAEAAANPPLDSRRPIRLVLGPDGRRHFEYADDIGPSPRDRADRALAEDWAELKGLPVGAPGEELT